jgi:hypothetical protein
VALTLTFAIPSSRLEPKTATSKTPHIPHQQKPGCSV